MSRAKSLAVAALLVMAVVVICRVALGDGCSGPGDDLDPAWPAASTDGLNWTHGPLYLAYAPGNTSVTFRACTSAEGFDAMPSMDFDERPVGNQVIDYYVYHWDYGDEGWEDNGPEPNPHQYSASGIYTVTLGVDDAALHWDDDPPDPAENQMLVVIFRTELMADGVDEDHEETPGAIVPINNDDDDGDAVEDWVDGDTVAGENDMLMLELAVDGSEGLPGTDTVTLTWTQNGKINVWYSALRTDPVQSGQTFSINSLPELELYVEGAAVSESLRDVEITLTYNKDGEISTDTVKVTVIRANLEVSGLTEEQDEDPGAFLGVNDDDDDTDDVVDKDDDLVPNEDALLAIQVKVEPAGAAGADFLKLTWSPDAKLDVFEGADKSGPVDSGDTFALSIVPKTLYMEADGASAAPRDMEVLLTCKNGAGRARLKVTAAAVDLDIDSDNDNGFLPPEENDEEDQMEDEPYDLGDPGKFVAVNKDDYDNDGIPDFADGFNWNGSATADADHTTPGDHFVPLILKVPMPLDVADTGALIKITYDASNPADVGYGGTPPAYTLPATGKLRIWKKNASDARDTNPANVENPGDYVPSGEYTAAQLGVNSETRKAVLYVEGVDESDTVGAQRILVEVDPDRDGPAGFVVVDAVRITCLDLDIDIDSDNDDGFDTPDRNAFEDQMENISDAADTPGKIIGVNDNDNDADGIPDFADGFNLDGIPGNDDDACAGDTFARLVLQVPAPLQLPWVKITLSYEDPSDPAGVTCTGTPPTYTPAAGKLRIWKKDGSDARDTHPANLTENPGDYVPPGDYTAAQLGVDGETRIATLYVEGIDQSDTVADQQIRVQIDPDGDGDDPVGYVAEDAVRLTLLVPDLDVDADRNGVADDGDDSAEMRFTSTTGAILLVNCDDENDTVGGRHHDNEDSIVNGADDVDDLAPLALRKLMLKELPAGWTARLRVSASDADHIRIFDAHDTTGTAVIGPWPLDDDWDTSGLCVKDVSFAAEALHFPDPGRNFSGLIKVWLAVENAANEEVCRDEVLFKVAPFLMLGNTAPTDRTYVSDYDDTFAQRLETIVTGAGADAPDRYPDATYPDVWIQDEIEIGYTALPRTATSETFMHVVLDSPRRGIYGPRPLDPFPEDVLLGRDFGHYNAPGSGVTGDSFGNLEVSPPVTGYPRGRIYVGDGMDTDLRLFLAAQGLQTKCDEGQVTSATANGLTDSSKNWDPDEWDTHATTVVVITGGKGFGQIRQVTDNDTSDLTVTPAWDVMPNRTSSYRISSVLTLRTTWLSVQHVDEVFSFVPDSGGDYRLLVADPCLGLRVLAGLLDKNDTGTASSGTATSLVDASKGWDGGEWQGGYVYISEGTCNGQIRRVLSNTATTLELHADESWDDDTPDTTSKYTVYALRETGTCSDYPDADDQLEDSSANLAEEAWRDGFVRVTEGACEGQVRQIKEHTPTVITVRRAWDDHIDTGSATSATNTTLTDSAKTWKTDQWKHGVITIIGGTGQGQERIVDSNDTTAVTVTAAWGDNPDTSSEYRVVIDRPNASSTYELINRGAFRAMFFEGEEEAGVSSSDTGANNTLIDSTKSWPADKWNGGVVLLFRDGCDTAELRSIADTPDTDDAGTATAATTGTLSDSSKTWATDQWVGATVEITSGLGAGQTRHVSSSDTTQLTVSDDWDTAPSRSDSGTASGGGDATLADASKTWSANEWATGTIEITGGTGSGQERIVDSNDTTTIIVTAAWDDNPDTTSQYTLRLSGDYTVTLGANIRIAGTWSATPTKQDKYVLVEAARVWDSADSAAVTVWELLTQVDYEDLRLPGIKDRYLRRDCRATYAKVWGSKGILVALKTGLGGIPDDRIDSVPALFVAYSAPSGADAFVPGMVNLLSVVSTTNTAAIARPFGPRNLSGDDVFEDQMDDALSTVIAGAYVDDWDTYHVNMGEVHCGINTKRDLPADKRWWDEW